MPNSTEAQVKESRRMASVRSTIALILVILASLGVIVSLVGGWVRSTLFDTESFMEVVQPVLSSDEVQTVLGDAISEQVTIAIDVEGRLETRLGGVDAYLSETLIDALNLPSATRLLLARSDLPRLAGLAGAIAEPIERRIEGAVHRLVSSNGFQEQLPQALAFAHRGAVDLIRQDAENLENVAIVDGEVRWNIVPLVESAIGYAVDEGALAGVLESIPLPGATYEGRQEDAIASLGEALGTNLPEDFGQVTVMSEERLEGWQSIARLIDRAALAAILVTVALLGIALWVSQKKRRTIVQFAAGSVIAIVVAAIIQRNVLGSLAESIPGPPGQAAAEVMFDAVLANLRTISLIFLSVAIVVGFVAHVAGQPDWLKAIRNQEASGGEGAVDRLQAAIEHRRDAFVVGGIAAALLAWWWLGINLATLLIIGAVLAGYLWYVTRIATRGELAETA